MNMNKFFLLKVLIVLFCFNISTSFAATLLAGFNAIYKGNNITADEEFPFVVVIYNISKDDSLGLCTGSIIGKNWVLTAGHCVRTPFDSASVTSESLLSPDTLRVGVSLLDLIRPQAQQLIHVKKIFSFSDKADMGHDIALLQLTDATDIQPVALPSYDDFPNIKSSQLPATAVGYGWIDERLPTDPAPATENNDMYTLGKDGNIHHIDGHLHYGDEITQDDQAVEKFLGIVNDNDKKKFEDDMAATLGVISPDGKGVTNGDSGGPLLLTVTQKDGSKQYRQIGVASWMLKPETANQQGYFSMYANLTNRDMLDFIDNTMKNNP